MSKTKKGLVISLIASVVAVTVLVGFGVAYVFLPIKRGSETSPSEFNAARTLWQNAGYEHYRLVAWWHYEIVGGCSEDVEIVNERVVTVYESSCDQDALRSVSGLFELFSDRLGSERTRVRASTLCNYWILEAEFDPGLGYPIHLGTELGSSSRRYQILDPGNLEFECLTIGPVRLTAEIESITPLP